MRTPLPVPDDAARLASGGFKVGAWRAEPSLNELSRDGETRRIEPKAMEVLAFLAARPGRVVSRDALLEALWPGVIVGDDSLTQAVIKLRKALDDPPRKPQYIETIAKRGYRLIAEVKPLADASIAAGVTRAANVADESDDPIPSTPSVPTPAARSRRLARAALLAIVVLGGVIAVAAYFGGEGAAGPDLVMLDDPARRDAVIPTLLVAPFEALPDGREETYLARGITADLMTDLSTVSALRILGPQMHSPGAATAAAPRYVLSGSVQRIADSVRVNVRLTDGETGAQLWAERYERTDRDVLSIQSSIIAKALQSLPVRISEAERARLARRYTRNLEAYDHFLRAKAAFLVRRDTDNAEARALYWRAIALDPAFARAYSGLALTHANDYRYRWTPDGGDSLARAVDLARTALRIDPDLPEAHGVLAYVHTVRKEHRPAIGLLTRAIHLAPSYADGYAHLAAVYTYIGRPADAIPLVRTAARLNPDAGFLYFTVLGRAYLFLGDVQQSLLNLREARARNWADLETHVYLTAALVAAEDVSAAEWEAEEIRSLQPGFTAREWMQTYPMTDAGQKRRLLALLARVGL